MSQILLVEDDPEISSILVNYLTRVGYQLTALQDGLSAKKYLAQNQPQLVLLDLMLPYLSGDELLAYIRKVSTIPVIIISAKDLVQTKVDLLKSGADDYITKPFDLSEVAVRIETVLRRAGAAQQPPQPKLVYRDITIDTLAASVTVGKTAISLTGKEYLLLRLFVENPHQAFTKYQIYQAVWGDSFGADENTLNTHISNLRKKLKEANGNRTYIETLYGVGYRLA